MSAFSVLRRRSFDQLRQRYTTAAVLAFFWVVAAAIFAFGLRDAEGSAVGLPALWCASVSPLLPLVAAFLGMDAISSERSSGRLDLLLVTRAEVSDFFFARYVAVAIMLVFWLVVLLGFELLTLRIFAPLAIEAVAFSSFLPALFAIAVQGALWAAVATAVSAFSRYASISCVVTVAIVSVLPRLGWFALLSFSGVEHSIFGEIPIDAHALDMASGLVSVATLFGYFIFIALAFFLAIKRLSMLRLSGSGGRQARFVVRLEMGLSSALALVLVVLVSRFDATLELPSTSSSIDFSQRTLEILADSRGTIRVSAFLPRNDSRFRSTAQFLRTLKRRSEALGGARIEVFYIDPLWDRSATRRLVREGVQPPALVFDSGHRRSVLALDGSIDEYQAASAILRLITTAGHRRICWTRGHGESLFDDYGPQGMSDIARELRSIGYESGYLDLSAGSRIPAECALVVVAGAHNGFSRAEVGRLDQYLKEGGRLLLLDSGSTSGGIESILPSWGIRSGLPRPSDHRTLTGTDVVVSSFTDHPVVRALKGSQVIFDSPTAFGPSAAANTAGGIDRIDFSALAGDGVNIYAAASERGSAVGSDLLLRPTRIVAIGDESFAQNGQLRAWANANRDLFINAVAYLSGSGSVFSSGVGNDRFSTGMDLVTNRVFLVVMVLVVPSGLFALLVLLAWARRRR